MRADIKIATGNLKKRKLRTTLTLVGIIISIATIFMLVSLSLGLRDAVNEQFEALGADKFFIQPRTGFLGPPGSIGGIILTEEDIRTVEKVRGVGEVLATTVGAARVEYNDRINYLSVWGMETDTTLYIELGDYKVVEGRFLKGGESGVILGNNHKAGNIFAKHVSVGDTIIINGEEVRVRGILERIGNPEDDRIIIMNLEEFRDLFEIPTRVDWIVVQVEEAEDLVEISERVEKELLDERGLNEETQDFSILTPQELLGSIQNILNIITAFLAGVAAISLFVGGIGIANTMYTSVIERTREIGTMKAVGARNSDILKIFLIEAGILGLAGGVVGVALGITISKTIEYIAVHQLGSELLQASMHPALIIGCLIFAFAVGAVSGTLPALRASKLNPTDALRYE